MKVEFIGCTPEQIRWGSNTNPEGILEIGKIYEVQALNIHTWHSKYSLADIEGVFNTVCFEVVEDDPKLRMQAGCKYLKRKGLK